MEGLNQLPIPLLLWFREHARPLPWREEGEPYPIWVSEVMLQQTRVTAVLGYYRRFMEALPTVEALAACPEEELLKLWQGLGYYSRARNMRRAAQVIAEELGGQFPRTFAGLRALPGVGDYTAGAVASIAFGLPVPAVDGNVLRVAARISGDEGNITAPAMKKKVTTALESCIPAAFPGEFNQALMELGAVVCLPNGAPLCDRCPAADLCRARREGRTGELPVKGEKRARRVERRRVYLLFHGNCVALRRRPDKGLLAGLWEYPNEEEGVDDLQSWGISPPEWGDAGTARHIFTHVEWHMTALTAELPEPRLPSDWVWADRQELEGRYPVPNAFRPFRERVLTRLGRF